MNCVVKITKVLQYLKIGDMTMDAHVVVSFFYGISSKLIDQPLLGEKCHIWTRKVFNAILTIGFRQDPQKRA
ncbi:hypothetical protein ABRT01_14850 [Lentibacillus sp. L22]|uniref:hypothetical protein n=1 Tax=Lentibacillus daqui TaxID=2911514 RepID=UPI0022B08B55|nr:hypothetical protein [Lentibacillus daqui]